MKAWVITSYGSPETAFELQERADEHPGPGQVAIEVEAFGLNFADIMARNGLYRDAPPLPAVVGYEVCGEVVEVGEGVDGLAVGQRVVAFTRFGGYATRVVTTADGAVPISKEMDAGKALALAVQYVTAWFSAEERVSLFPGDHVLVQAAAGGVGTALVQLAKRRGCVVYGTAGSAAKLDFLRSQGVDHPINYREEDFYEKIKALRGEDGLDVVFDSLGGKAFKKGFKLLRPGGRIVGFGASSRSGKGKGMLKDIRMLLGFGFYNPAFLLMQSRAVIGVNMLRVADHKPMLLKHCLQSVVELAEKGEIDPVVGAVFNADQLGEAHAYVEGRKSMGKVIVKW